ILEVRDKDGVSDRKTVFLDSLKAPRAICLAYDGLLYAEPPNLWFVKIENDQPGQRTLVDSNYVDEGNIEHQPNGLLLNLDNWIYSANSNLRYRLREGQWERGYTSRRGQWGITADEEGRLYYNNNSVLLMGDQVLPQAALLNLYAMPKQSINQVLSPTQDIHPWVPNLVNRGYQKNVLDSLARIQRASSACGPCVYLSSGFPAEYEGDAFVALPEGNSIKHLDLTRENGRATATPSASDTEFLRSRDPFFRPVNLRVGPEGWIYVADMHRGVIQHQAYMTSYLREEILARRYDTAINQGRILVIKPEGGVGETWPRFSQVSTDELITALASNNAWTRVRAQQELITRDTDGLDQRLARMVQREASPSALHAFWTLEGRGAITDSVLNHALAHPSTALPTAALYLIAVDSLVAYDLAWQHLLDNDPQSELLPYLALALPRLVQEREARWQDYLSIAARGQQNPILDELAYSGLGRSEQSDDEIFWSLAQQESQPLYESIKAAEMKNSPNPMLTKAVHWSDVRTKGLSLYRQYCVSCHGARGQGQTALAPPLMESPIIGGPPEGLALVLLHGLGGPLVRRGDTLHYAAQMPGFAANSELSDRDLVDLMAYLRNAFSLANPEVKPQLVAEMRKKGWPQGTALTEVELDSLLKR
ncbi:MAG: c-type cytochrome, partial [Bacteroidota bacterium]